MIQLKVVVPPTSSMHLPDGVKAGDVVWVRSKEIARELIESGQCVLAIRNLAGPEETPTVRSPSELKFPCAPSPDAPLDRFSVIHPVWKGETVVCIGGGPSLTQETLERVRCSGAKVIAVNDAYLVAPWANVNYFADSRWWKWHSDGIAKSWPWVSFDARQVKEAFRNFKGQRITIFNTGLNVSDESIHMLHNFGQEGLSEKPNGLHTGFNSGYQAVNLAVLAGASRIVLVAYDMGYSGSKTHSHNGHPVKEVEQVYKNYARVFKTMLPQLKALGVEVFNSSMQSAITAFPKAPIESLLPNS